MDGWIDIMMDGWINDID